MATSAQGYLRIGELSRRVGVSPELLRAWETRYGLLRPSRSAGGFRLYSDEDEARVRLMRLYQERGLSAAEAARLAASAEPGAAPEAAEPDGRVAAEVARLRETLDAFDEAGAHGAFDRLVGALSTDALVREAVIPYLEDLGRRWEEGKASVAQEHFASNVLRGRLLGLARGWGQGAGPRAILACAPGEQHDLPLICFGLALRARGWRITYLGPDTPVDTLADVVGALEVRLVVVSASLPERLEAALAELRGLSGRTRLVVAGAGATAEAAERAGAELVTEDPVTAAERLSRRAA
ncbi:MAG TPA: cobalamin B12-binding domain-containing protein [Gaiellaceae bacterium]|nr:cobalamin B12-binding domain-containing protein [Gaiellaceae bacterium]